MAQSILLRLAAGASFIGLILTPNIIAQAQTKSETCEVDTIIADGTTKVWAAIRQRSATETKPAQAPFKAATLKLSPHKAVFEGLSFSSPERDELTITLSKDGSNYEWANWSLTLPRLISNDTTKAVRWFNYSVMQDNMRVSSGFVDFAKPNSAAAAYEGEGFLESLWENPTSNAGVEAPQATLEDYKESRSILSPRESSIAEVLTPSYWIKSGTPNSNLVFEITNDKNPSETATLEFSRANILSAANFASSTLSTLEERYQAGECTPDEVKEGCFLTTAACGVIGLQDNCWELRILREFRDNWLARQANGVNDIGRYYKTAPRIVKHVNQRADKQKIWLSLYARFILPCAISSRIGAKSWTHKRYAKMMTEMAQYS